MTLITIFCVLNLTSYTSGEICYIFQLALFVSTVHRLYCYNCSPYVYHTRIPESPQEYFNLREIVLKSKAQYYIIRILVACLVLSVLDKYLQKRITIQIPVIMFLDLCGECVYWGR